MKETLYFLPLCSVLLTSCQSPKPISPSVKIETVKPRTIQDGPLTIQFLETRLIEPIMKIPGSANVEVTVRFINQGEKRVAIHRSHSLDLDVKNEAGIAPKPLVVVDEMEPTPLDLIQLSENEDMVVKIFAGPFTIKNLGSRPQIRLVASTWDLKEIKHKHRFGQGMKVWPQKEFESEPLPLASNKVQRRETSSGATLEFLNVTSEKDVWWGRPGTRIKALYRISNYGQNPILAEDGYPLLNVFASDSKRSYPSPYEAVELSMPTIWNIAKIFPGESKTFVASVHPYYSTEMEETFDFRYEVHPWSLQRIENLPENVIPKHIKTFPAEILKSSLYNLDRRH